MPENTPATAVTQEKFNRLNSKLRELFELDKADLDFGIYRIIAQRQQQISDFLDHRLREVVQEELAKNAAGDRAALEAQLEEAIQSAKKLGADPETLPVVKQLRQQLAGFTATDQLESEIYHHLYSFFSRYYEEGDFISQRRVSRNEKYAIPYNGEEVKLHWANADQYYIKTAENFRNYRFKLTDGRAVEFRLRDADTARDNIKGDKRFFELAADEDGRPDVAEVDGALHIGFWYRPQPKKQADIDGNEKATSRDLLNAKAHAALFEAVPAEWHAAVFEPAPTDGKPDRTLLAKQLNDYTAKNSFDYFIHKDLGGFLRRELDFYIKNEVLFLDDIDSAPLARVEDALNSIRAIRQVAGKVIDFLAQIENFQKKLWLKKKFVVASNWCFTLDKIEGDEALLEEVCENESQRAEWADLFGLNLQQFVRDYEELDWDEFLAKPEYRFLVADTRNLDQSAKYRCLARFGDLNELATGCVVKSENGQALRFLQSRYTGKVGCIYIDPPYNTGNDGFKYKDHFRHSAWLSLIDAGLSASKSLAQPGASFFCSIDDNEVSRLRQLLDARLGEESFECQICIQSNKRGQTYKSISKTHEYLIVYGIDGAAEIRELPKDKEFKLRDEKGGFELWELRNRNPKFGRFNRPNLYYPVYVQTERPEGEYFEVSAIKPSSGAYEVAYPRNSRGEDGCWRWSKSALEQSIDKHGSLAVVAKKTRSGAWSIFEKARKATTKAKSLWLDTDVISEQGTTALNAMGLREFGFPKPPGLLARALRVGCDETSLVMDFFAGSGTTADAVISLNREEGSSRRFLLCEHGDYCDRITVPRIKKAAYAKVWKAGLPSLGQSQTILFSRIELESYEDTQNNLRLERTDAQGNLLEARPEAAEDYLLNYMLDVEAEGSLLNLAGFTRPFDYQLLIAGDTAGEMKPTDVDLVETFNYLIGLTVQRVAREKFLAEGEGAELRARRSEDGHVFVTVEGTLPNGNKALVIWRDLPGWDDPAEKTRHNALLDAVLDKLRINPRETEFDVIYVNGDNTLPNACREEDHWKVELIEPEFHRLMFDTSDAV